MASWLDLDCRFWALWRRSSWFACRNAWLKDALRSSWISSMPLLVEPFLVMLWFIFSLKPSRANQQMRDMYHSFSFAQLASSSFWKGCLKPSGSLMSTGEMIPHTITSLIMGHMKNSSRKRRKLKNKRVKYLKKTSLRMVRCKGRKSLKLNPTKINQMWSWALLLH